MGVVFGGGGVGRVGREGLFCGVETQGDDGGGEGSRKWSITVRRAMKCERFADECGKGAECGFWREMGLLDGFGGVFGG